LLGAVLRDPFIAEPGRRGDSKYVLLNATF
jgi:hypothetical protein